MAFYQYNGSTGTYQQVMPPQPYVPGVLGAHVWAVNVSGSTIPYGGLIAGSALSPIYMQIQNGGSNYNWSGGDVPNFTWMLSGTWMNTGRDNPGADSGYYCIGLWVRVA